MSAIVHSAQCNNYLGWNTATLLTHTSEISGHIARKWHLWMCMRLLNHYNHLGHPFEKMALGIDIALLGHLIQGVLSQMQNLMLFGVLAKP